MDFSFILLLFKNYKFRRKFSVKLYFKYLPHYTYGVKLHYKCNGERIVLDKKQFIEKIDEKLKLIRNEKDFTQDRMAEIIGISKKTLVQIEKGRSSLGWTGAVTVSTIFKDSEILQMTFGGDTEDIILSIAFNNYEDNYKNTLGGKVWWRKIKSKGIYTIQQNIITNHYRILDDKDRRISSSFDINYIEKRLEELYEQGGK